MAWCPWCLLTLPVVQAFCLAFPSQVWMSLSLGSCRWFSDLTTGCMYISALVQHLQCFYCLNLPEEHLRSIAFASSLSNSFSLPAFWARQACQEVGYRMRASGFHVTHSFLPPPCGISSYTAVTASSLHHHMNFTFSISHFIRISSFWQVIDQHSPTWLKASCVDSFVILSFFPGRFSRSSFGGNCFGGLLYYLPPL